MNSKYESRFDSKLATVFASVAIMLTGAGAMIAQSQMARANSPAVQLIQVAPQKAAVLPVASNECVAVAGSAAPTYRCASVTVVAKRTVKNVEVATAR
jgi:hypothetical protein